MVFISGKYSDLSKFIEIKLPNGTEGSDDLLIAGDLKYRRDNDTYSLYANSIGISLDTSRTMASAHGKITWVTIDERTGKTRFLLSAYSGSQMTITCFVNEQVSKYFTKGSFVGVSGIFSVKEYKGKASLSLFVNSFSFLGSKKEGDGNSQNSDSKPKYQSSVKESKEWKASF